MPVKKPRRDSKLWEEAYAAKDRFKKKKPTHKSFIKRLEPMALQHELVEINESIKKLYARKKEIGAILRKKGQKPMPYGRSAYFDKPIMLYALHLNNGYYYVGSTRNPEKRLKTHIKGKGAIWTKKHGVIDMFDIRETNTTNESTACKLEDDMTIEYAMKYGSDNVRGGGYCQSSPRWPQIVIQNELPRYNG